MRTLALALAATLVSGLAGTSLQSQTPPRGSTPAGAQQTGRGGGGRGGPPDFDKQIRDQAATNRTWRAASDGVMQMDRITYRSKVGDMDIPAFVFQPLKLRGAKGHPRDRLGAREHPRASVRTLHSVHP